MSTATRPTRAVPQQRGRASAQARPDVPHPRVRHERAHPPAGSLRVSERSSAALAARTAELVLEVLNGRRRPAVLGDLLTHEGLAWIAARRPTSSAPPPNYRLRSVHTSLITDQRVEMCWIVDTTERTRALISTAERRGEQWRCGRFALV
ncbi:hypothetical protein GCM10027174_37880 [Salinifilum aidingensis]